MLLLSKGCFKEYGRSMSIRKPYVSKRSHEHVPNSFRSFSVQSTWLPATHSGVSPISSSQQTDALHNSAIQQLKPYSIEPKLRLELSTTVIDFHPVKVSKPEFALLTVQPDETVKSISVHCDRSDLFQIASDEHPDYRANSRITAQSKITYIHIRYLSNQLFSKPQFATLFIQAESEIREVVLIAHPMGRWATLNGSLTKIPLGGYLVMVSGLLFGVYTTFSINVSGSQACVSKRKHRFNLYSPPYPVYPKECCRWWNQRSSTPKKLLNSINAKGHLFQKHLIQAV